MKLFIKLMLLLLVLGGVLPFITFGPDGSPLFKLKDLQAPELKLPSFLNPTAIKKQFSDSTQSSKPRTIYKWYDTDGQMHYTSEPPPTGTRAEIIQLQSDVGVQLATEPGILAKTHTPKETGRPSVSKNLGEPHSPMDVQQVIDHTRNVQRLLNERKQAYDRLLDKE